MEAHINTYRLNQGNKEYILTISLISNSIRITCKDSSNENLSFSRDFTIEELKKLDPIFNVISTPLEALDYMDKALKIQKVGISEEDDTLKINFFVTTQGVVHQLEIPLGESGQDDEFNNFNETTNEEQFIQTTNTTTQSAVNLNHNLNLGFDQNEIFGQTNKTNIYNETLPTITPADDSGNQYLSQLNTVSQTSYSQLNNVNANEYNLSSELVEGNANIVSGTVDNNVYQETQNEYTTGLDTTNLQYMQGVESTDNIMQNLENNQITTDVITNTGLDSNIQYSGEVTDAINQFTSVGDTTSITSQYGQNIDTTNQYTTKETTDLTSQYLTGENIDLNTQYTTDAKQDLLNAQYTTGATQDLLNTQYTTDVTQDLNTQLNIGVTQDTQEYTSQYTNGLQDLNINANENASIELGGEITNNLEQYTTGTDDLTNKYLEQTKDTNLQYPGSTNVRYSNEVNTFSSSSPLNLQLGKNKTQFDSYKSTTQTIRTTNKSFNNPVQSFSKPYITPADDITTKIDVNEYKVKEYNKPSQLQTQAQSNNYYKTTQTTTTKKTTKKSEPTATVVSVPQAETKVFTLPLPKVKNDTLKVIDVKKEVIRKTFTDNQTQYDLKNEEKKVPDPILNQIEGTTNSLKNEHQLIQDKLNALTRTINTYKNQLSIIDKGGSDSEISNLRAENKAIKQQLTELNSLRNDAAEVKFLRNQLHELDPLRRKVAEMEIIKGQLGELNELKAKLSEYNKVKAQLQELNTLRQQVAQMNVLKQQLGELDSLRRRVAELNGVKSKLGELNSLRAQVGQINILKKQFEELTKLKMNALDLEKLKLKIDELETIKLKYEQEILQLKTQQKAQLLHREMEKAKYQEFQMRSAGMDSRQLYIEEMPQQICVKGDIIHNTDELELLTRKINKLNQRLTLNLLYKATADSDKASAFHAKCDDARSTLVLVETDKGRRFGGFTTCSWSGDCIEKKDEDAFVFSLDKMEIYENIPGEDAIGCYPKFGPIFLGCQIRIYDNAFTKGGTTFEKGLNFNTEEDYELTGGERTFMVKDIEVYEVIPS